MSIDRSKATEAAKQPGLIERALAPILYGRPNPLLKDDRLRYLEAERKGVAFPFEQWMRGSNYSGPIAFNMPGTYGTNIDYLTEVGNIIDNSAVSACLLWGMTNFTRAPIRVAKQTAAGNQPVANHRATQLLTQPNQHYSGKTLWQASYVSFGLEGEAYWIKVRNAVGVPVELWYEPHWTCRPVRTNPQDFISHYQIWRDRKWIDIPREDIVHLRFGMDPQNPMHGMSRLKAALREIFNDNEAARYSALMFRNMGIAPLIFSPKEGAQFDDTRTLKMAWEQASTGDNKGRSVWLSEAVDVFEPSNDPDKMNTRDNRKISEERISGLLQIPAVIAGLGAGLDRNTFANADAAERWAWNHNIIPTQDTMTEDLDIQLLPEFSTDRTEHIEFDNSGIEVLQAVQNERDKITAELWEKGLLKRSEARVRLSGGYTSGPEDEVYKEASPAATLPAVGAAKALQNGHGVEAA